MAALTKGAKAPEFRLPLLQGGEFEVAGDTDAVLVWFKVECPVCQYAMPYFERLWQRLSATGSNVKFVGVSQNDANATREFANRYGVTFPVALDPAPKYTASNAYGLTNVPTAFYVSGGQVEFVSVSWVKDELEGLYRTLMEGRGIEPLFAKDESVAAWKAG